MKKENEEKLDRFDTELLELTKDKTNVKDLIDQLVNTVENIVPLYANSGVEFQRQLISAIYPQKLVFNGVEYRTPKFNPGAKLIELVNKELAKNKNGKELDFSNLSHQVISLGFEPRTPTLKVLCSTS